jgi:DNA repair exonuclease SbcCD nuclease subunit
MSKPIAVLISDIHFTVSTLEFASQSLLKAQFKAKLLNVPLVIAGDTLDSKAVVRAECANKLISMLSVIDAPDTIMLVGNHDLCNEKGKDHSLNFLKPYCTVIDSPQIGRLLSTEAMLIPYQSDPQAIKNILSDEEHSCPKLIIMHQGIIGSEAGHYIQDKSALSKEDVADFRVISGHYHKRQHIITNHKEVNWIGTFSYIGNPYTLGFGEANDPPKGFQILMDDGSLEFVPTNLRKHVIIEHDLTTDESKWSSGPIIMDGNIMDLVWVKIKGTKEQLMAFNKNEWLKDKGIPRNVKIDLIPTETETAEVVQIENTSQDQVFDGLIDSLTNTSEDRKTRLKTMWKNFTE